MGVASHAATEVPKVVKDRPRHRHTIAYIAPLGTSRTSSPSHIVGITNWLGEDDDIREHLRAFATGFYPDEMPFTPDDVICVRLGVTPSELPAGLFASGILNDYDWGQEALHDEFLRMFCDKYADRGHIVRSLSSSIVVLRAGAPPSEPDEVFPRGFPYWDERPAIQLVDLDFAFRAIAVTGLRTELRDLGPASAALPFERSILDERAMKWAGTGFLTPEATFEDYQQDRLGAVERLGQMFFKRPVARARWQDVGPAIEARAATGQVTPETEMENGRRHNLILVLPDLIASEVTAYEGVLMTSPPWPLPAYQADFDAFREGLLRRIAAELNNAFTVDYLDDPAWRHTREGLESPIANNDVSIEMEAVHDEAPQSADELLYRAFGRSLVIRANFTPIQKRVAMAIATMEEGDTLAAWAERNGMKPATAYVHVSNIKKRLAEAMKLA